MRSRSARSASPSRAASTLVRHTSSIHPCVADDPTFGVDSSISKATRSISDTGKIAPKKYKTISDAWAFWLFVLSFPLLYYYGEKEKRLHPAVSNQLHWISLDLKVLEFTESKHLTFPAIVVGAMFAVLFIIESFPKIAITVLYFAVPIQSFYNMLLVKNSNLLEFKYSLANLCFWLLVSWWSFSKFNLKFVAAMVSAGSKGLRHNWGTYSVTYFIILFLLTHSFPSIRYFVNILCPSVPHLAMVGVWPEHHLSD